MSANDIDVLIRDAKVVDGTGNPWYYGDIALQGERILAIAPSESIPVEAAREVVDGVGMVVCPGFIDILSHSHIPLMHDPRDLSKLTQGVTSEIMGEGWTPAPVGGRFQNSFRELSLQELTLVSEWIERAKGWTRPGDWLDALVERGVSPNIGTFLGGGTLREYAKGQDMDALTPEEMAIMRRVTAEAMEDGAFGVSFALIYPPDAYTSMEELVEIAQVVGRYGGIYVTHIRNEGDWLLDALDEALEIGWRAGVPVEIYHLKASGKQNWPRMEWAIERMQQVRDAGRDVTADMYPYAASGTGLDSVLPPWLAEGGTFFRKLADPSIREQMRADVLDPKGSWEAMAHNIGPDGIMPVGFERPENLQYAGKRLSEIAAMRSQHWFDSVVELLLSERQRIFTIYMGLDEANVALGLQQPWVKIATDAGGVDPAWAKSLGPTHPRAYGTYPRVLAKYVREEKLLTLEDAIRKMSGSVASRLGLRDRGLLLPGFYADVVLFDAETVSDRATFEDSHQLSVGIRDVWVNGSRVIRDGQHTGATPGKVLRRFSMA